MSKKGNRGISKKRPRVWLKGLRDAEAVHAQIASLLLRYPNVLTVGVGAPERRGRKGDRAAIVVGVRNKKDMHPHETIPHELLGVRIDVKEISLAKLAAGIEVRAGMQCRGYQRAEFGYLGVAGGLPDGGRAVLTTLHVLVDEQLSTDVDSGDFRDMVVEVALPGKGGYTSVGKLQRGAFNAREDIALVRIDDGFVPSALLAGSTTKLAAPVAIPTTGAAFELLAPDGAHDGTLVNSKVDGRFDTAAGPQLFHGLAQFSFAPPRIRLGWCGSPICVRGTHAPVGLLSFCSDDGASAYVFPLASHWQAWGLSTPKDID
jgi:hypothetical protein